MRKIVFYILLIVFMLNFRTVSSQIIVDTMVCDYQSKNYKCYTITNNTNDNYLTWVSPYNIQGKTEEQLYREYFIRRVKSDFSFFDLMIEETISDELYNIIGFSFLKVIPPFSEFMYCIEKNAASVYLDNIIVTKQDYVYKYIAMLIPQKFYYTCDTIYVNAEFK